MPSTRRLRAAFAAILLALAPVPGVPAGEPPPPGEPTLDLERLYREVRQVVRRHYPDATAHRLGDRIHFEHDTRVFVVHEPLKTGEWQDPVEERGPRLHGVLGDVEWRTGTYGGQAEVPQTFDKRYFTVTVLAPASARLGGHLYVCLKLPSRSRAPDGFVDELTALLAGFERYVAGGG